MSLAERLRRSLMLPPREPMLPGDLPEQSDALAVPAAVLIAITDRAEPGVILTVRREDMRTHAGQVAFPGGKQEPGDATPLAAALREAEEEIALRADQVEVLGGLDPHETVTSFAVRPFVGLIDPGFRAVPDPGEVEEVFEVPLAFALDPGNMQVHGRVWQGVERRYYVIPYGPHYIWGATARMLKALSDRVLAS